MTERWPRSSCKLLPFQSPSDDGAACCSFRPHEQVGGGAVEAVKQLVQRLHVQLLDHISEEAGGGGRREVAAHLKLVRRFHAPALGDLADFNLESHTTLIISWGATHYQHGITATVNLRCTRYYHDDNISASPQGGKNLKGADK